MCCISLGLVLAARAAGAEYPSDVRKWISVEQPSKDNWEASQSFFMDANHSKYEWEVKSTSDGVIACLKNESSKEEKRCPEFDTTVQLDDTKAKASQMLEVEDGWIAAYNEGEFGSAVYWFSKDGLVRRKLSAHQINQFMVEGTRIFAVEGLAHLSRSTGSMIEIKHDASGWNVDEFLPLPGSAEAITRIGEGDYVIVASGMLLRVNLQKEVLILVLKGEWGGMYPNSITADSEFIYIGMRQYVARCRIAKSIQSAQLLVPATSWLSNNEK
jgi:hypothetical protein